MTPSRHASLASAALLLLSAAAARADSDEDACLQKDDRASCLEVSKWLHRKNELPKLVSNGDAAKLKAYRDSVETFDAKLCMKWEETRSCEHLVDVLKLDPPTPERAKRITEAQTKLCVKGGDQPICKELKAVAARGGLSEEEACLQKNFTDDCISAANKVRTELSKLNPSGDVPQRKALGQKALKLLGTLWKGENRSVTDLTYSILLGMPRTPEEDQLLLEVSKQQCTQGDTLACQRVQKQQAKAASAAASTGERAECLDKNDAASCYRRAQEYFMTAMQLRRPGREKELVPVRDELLLMSSKACELGKSEGCSVFFRGLELSEATDTDLQLALKVFEAQCKRGNAIACTEFKARQASGGRPKAREPQNKDVAAVLALLKSKGTLAGAQLAGKELEGISLVNADLKGANLKGATLSGADLTGAKLDGANLDAANLEKCTIESASLAGATAKGANFTDASGSIKVARGAHFEGAKLGKALDRAEGLEDVHVEGAELLGCDWNHRDLRKTGLRGAVLRSCDLSYANLSGVDLTEADLQQGKVGNAQFVGAKLDRAKLTGVSFSDTDLTNASLVEAQADNSLYSTKKMSGANFTGANLKDARFMAAASVAGAKFDRAIVCGSDIEKASGWASATSSGAQKQCP